MINETLLQIGLEVQIHGSRISGTIIRINVKKQSCTIDTGNATIDAQWSKLKLKMDAKNSCSSTPKAQNYHNTLNKGGKSKIPTIDLHGYTREQALEALDAFLDKQLVSGNIQFEVIHGIGSGVLKKSTHDYLQKCKHVKHFSISEFNPGSTKAFLA